VVFGDGRQTRDFTFVADIVEGTLAAAAHGRPGASYNLGGGSRVSMLEVLDLIRQETGGLQVRHEQQQRGDARDTAADISLAAAELGYRPTRTVAQGIAEQVAWRRDLS
jgi:nucleoside-diphosphate-sugar epimerase